jgi:hypothetical protein
VFPAGVAEIVLAGGVSADAEGVAVVAAGGSAGGAEGVVVVAAGASAGGAAVVGLTALDGWVELPANSAGFSVDTEAGVTVDSAGA